MAEISNKITRPHKKPRFESDYFLDVNSTNIENTNDDGFGNDFNEYLHTPRVPRHTDILEWWKKHEMAYPKLSQMARHVLSTLASSVPIERFFFNRMTNNYYKMIYKKMIH